MWPLGCVLCNLYIIDLSTNLQRSVRRNMLIDTNLLVSGVHNLFDEGANSHR